MALLCFTLLSSVIGLAISAAVPPAESENTFSKASNNFALDLLRAAGKEDGNVLMSPTSIGILLAMIQQGAKETTAEELEKVLYMPADVSAEAFSCLKQHPQSEESNVTLEWANSIYLKHSFHLEDAFKSLVTEKFQSKIQEMDFTNPSTAEAAKTINEWVSGVTHGRISDLVDPSTFNDDTIMVMVNAIYFKGLWANPFEKYKTTPGEFEKSEGNSVKVFFMSQEETLRAGEDSDLGLKWVELPYQEDQYSMLLILPIEKFGLEKVMEKLTGAELQKIMANTEERNVHLTIPKFQLSWSASLQNILEKLGLTTMFTNDANFGGISSSHDGLKVSYMIHKAEIEVDENGSVAAAGSYIALQTLSLILYPNQMQFHADHPFLAFIIDKQRNLPLFAAKITSPTYTPHAD